MMKCPQQCFESTFRRYQTPAEMIIRAFSTNDMLPLTSEGNVQHFLNILKDTNICQNIFGKLFTCINFIFVGFIQIGIIGIPWPICWLWKVYWIINTNGKE